MIYKTENYIKKNHEKLLDDFLTYDEFEYQKNNKYIGFYENILSKYFFDYLNDERILYLPIYCLHRILLKTAKIIQKTKTPHHQNMAEREIIDFVFQCAKIRGFKASVLFYSISRNNYTTIAMMSFLKSLVQ